MQVGARKKTMEVERPWEGVLVQQQAAMDDETEDAAAAAGGLQTRELKNKMKIAGHGDNGDQVVMELLKAAAATAEEEDKKSVFFDRAKAELHVIEVEKDENATEGKTTVEDYDLEKILYEQETQDIYCPNCKTPIRVILKKRKPPAIPEEPPTEEFRCLTCFCSFIRRGLEMIGIPAPPAERDEWDVLKAIVYGGLVESITSLSVVSAAAASGAKTLDIFILGLANLVGGLPVIYHKIADLRNTGDVAERSEQVGYYWFQLGRQSKYKLHMVIAILSYILFGLLPPVIYGLSFRTSDNRENKMMAVAAASLMCITLLAMGEAHVKRSRTYFTTLLYYLSIGFSSSGLSYVAGVLITRLLAHFGLIDQGGASAPAPPSLLFPQAMGVDAATWASY